ncbi:MAG: hypothetical protein ACRCVT_05625 [Leadbetterella sp.]
MKTIALQISCLAIILLGACSSESNSSTPPSQTSTGSASTKLNGANWSASWATSLLANLGGTKVLTININLSEKNTSEGISIGLNDFSGTGTYSYGASGGKALLSIKYKGKYYTTSQLSKNVGSGTIKITEYVASQGILNPGKAVGEFSGTLKSYDSDEMLTVSNGKFTSIIVL